MYYVNELACKPTLQRTNKNEIKGLTLKAIALVGDLFQTSFPVKVLHVDRL